MNCLRRVRAGLAAGIPAVLFFVMPSGHLSGHPAMHAEEGQEATGEDSGGPDGVLPIGRDYYDVAAATGGEFYFWAPGEFSTAGEVAPIERETLFLAYGQLPDGDVTHRIVVDPSLASLAVFAGAQRLDRFELYRPDGTLVRESTGVTHRLFRHMAIVKVRGPDPGEWVVRMSGEGYRSVSVRGSPPPGLPDSATISLRGFELVELAGHPAHEGLFPIEGPTEPGQATQCLAKMLGPVATAELVFVSLEGESIGKFGLSAGHPAAARGELVGECEVPRRPFRAMITGEHLDGISYQRLHPPLLRPSEQATLSGGTL